MKYLFPGLYFNTKKMNRKVIFVDDDSCKFVIDVKIENGNLSIRSESGQGQFNPSTDEQQQLLDIWNKWHLNDVNAGTVEQKEFLLSKNDDYEAIKKINPMVSYYEWALAVLAENEKSHINGINSAHPITGEPYVYGSAWLTHELPEDFEEELDELLDCIEEEYITRRNDSQKCEDLEKEEFLSYVDEHGGFFANECACAIGIMFELTLNELISDVSEHRHNRWTIQGHDYLVGTDDEMDKEWEEDLDNYLEECVLCDIKDESLKRYFDKESWISDAKMDGRGHSLNRYDGGEESCKIGDTWYYAYRQ